MLSTLAVLLSLTSLHSAPVATRGNEVDVELVLAVDTSRSMDYEEVRIQREGYVAALQHPEFINAVKMGLIGKIAITYYEWAGEVDPSSVLDWQIIETGADAKAFADKLAARPIATQRRTSISAAITYGTSTIGGNRFEGLRKVIDVSGDGPNNMGAPVESARDQAIASGIIINGLALVLRPSGTTTGLDRYYKDCVIGGPGSFVLPVQKIEDFEVAVRRKLIMEVSGLQQPADIWKIAAEPKSDCFVGENQWREFFDR
ncbi:DUF1194 domain-containing protein [Rhizobium sp. FKY42]|uniref:DUF1194 domain-containing protein n=1 Tax=Rhizobium sp. FKY42 TaxID=2562310 RepID=UPI0010C07C6F|nr:DUF1194 domain-containing protein [Rhizobium sp. FKY42]